MKIQTYAALKDFFGKEFEIDLLLSDISALQRHLTELKPEASALLQISRFAVGDEFINSNYQLKEDDTICIIPPSSGG